MSISQPYDSSVNAWRSFLEKTADRWNGAKWWQNLEYFRDVVGNVLDDGFDREQLWKTMYRHPLAWFYRWNILDGISWGYEFEAKFHVFPESSRTHIHAHGYEGLSHILDGKLSVFNFRPELAWEAITEILRPLRTDAFAKVGDIQTPMFHQTMWGLESISEYIEQLWLHQKNNWNELTQLYQKYWIINIAAFKELQREIQSNPSIIITIEDELFHVLIWERTDVGYHTRFLVHVVLWLSSLSEFAKYFFQNDGTLYHLENSRKFEVGKWETHHVWVNEAHSVEVVEQDTATLFMTRKPKNVSHIQEGWEFHIFRQSDTMPERYQTTPEEARNYIFDKLRAIFSQ